jgi:hypothetical protein
MAARLKPMAQRIDLGRIDLGRIDLRRIDLAERANRPP